MPRCSSRKSQPLERFLKRFAAPQNFAELTRSGALAPIASDMAYAGFFAVTAALLLAAQGSGVICRRLHVDLA